MKTTNKLLQLIYPNLEETTYIIFNEHKFTPSGFCIEYKNYYEIACYSSYYRIDKKTLVVTSNMKDVDVYAVMKDYKVIIHDVVAMDSDAVYIL